ncbi:hypothetical protein Fot_53700 [Forsythia ovata]|uniref:Uncharacterized protein n=1 Tax=Forsythia ovata TaxID=205694 RepID=A0ABD1PEZ1_9LAMI
MLSHFLVEKNSGEFPHCFRHHGAEKGGKFLPFFVTKTRACASSGFTTGSVTVVLSAATNANAILRCCCFFLRNARLALLLGWHRLHQIWKRWWLMAGDGG